MLTSYCIALQWIRVKATYQEHEQNTRGYNSGSSVTGSRPFVLLARAQGRASECEVCQ